MPSANKGIWKFAERLDYIEPKFRLTLGEGKSPLKKIGGFYLKCEYLNPSGSVKDRGICFQVAKLRQKGIKRAVIPSSGNAAVSASEYCRKAGIELTVFVSPNINPAKLKLIKQNLPRIVIDKRPLSRSIQFAKKNGLINMRPSTDKFGQTGYRTISFELNEEIPDCDAVFIPVSSGTILRGVYEGFSKSGRIPAIHAVQTAKINTVAADFDHDFIGEKTSLASAIVARFVPHLEEVKTIIKGSKGWAWVISDSEIKKAERILKQNKIICSSEGALALAGQFKAESKGYQYKKPVCLLTGSI